MVFAVRWKALLTHLVCQLGYRPVQPFPAADERAVARAVILSEVVGVANEISENVMAGSSVEAGANILVADDSSVARRQIKRTLDQLGIESTLVNDGKEALDVLLDWAEEDADIAKHLTMVISDVEMPNMDGYTLTTEIRKNPILKDLHVILHTSLSGVFNQAMVEKVGANKFIAKFNADELAGAVLEAVALKDARQSES